MMTETEAVSYIENYTWSATRLGLDRTRTLLSKLGDPQKGLKFVHVAGSNGKGSTFCWVGTGSQLIEKAEGTGVCFLLNTYRIGHVGGEST